MLQCACLHQIDVFLRGDSVILSKLNERTSLPLLIFIYQFCETLLEPQRTCATCSTLLKQGGYHDSQHSDYGS